MDSSGSGERPVVGSCEHVNKHSDNIKVVKLLFQLTAYKLLKKNTASMSYLLTVHLIKHSPY
jgi:hypothetical protein